MTAHDQDDIFALSLAAGVGIDLRDETIAAVMGNFARALAVIDPDVEYADLVDLAPVPWVVADVDHGRCEGYGEGAGCDRVICCCRSLPITGPCTDTVEQACPHHQLLCDECRSDCDQCRIDARHDEGGL